MYRLRRLTFLRRLYVRVVDPRRFALFSLTDWVREGQQFQAGGFFDGILFEPGQTWVRTPCGLEIGFMTQQPGGGLDASLYCGRYAPALTRLIADHLPPDAVMLDIGASIGWVALSAASARGNARVYAFEPGKFAFNQLRANIERNKMTNRVIAINKAVADMSRIMWFSNDSFAHTTNHLISGQAKYPAGISVQTISIDNFVAQEALRRLDLVKCDVEGAELLVLQGAQHTIADLRPTFVLEVDARWLNRFGSTPQEVIDFMHDRGYDFRIERDRHEENWVFFPVPAEPGHRPL